MRNRTRMLAVVAVATLAMTACGGDDDDATSPDTDSASSAAPAETAAAATSPETAETAETATDATPSEDETSETTAEATETTVASGADLEPAPLAERQNIKLGLSGPLENYMPVMLADSLGEFEKENIDVEIVFAPPTDQVQLLAADQIQASLQAIGLASFNAIASGVDMRFVFPNTARTDPKQSGWWVRNDVIGTDGFQPADLNGQTLISPSGATGLSPAVLIPQLVAEDPNFDPESVTHDRMALADMPIAMINGAVGAANLTAPFWQPVEESGCCTFIDYGVDWPTTELIFGRKLLDQPEVATAFLRAVTRTVNENLQPGYHDDAELMAKIAELTEQPVDVLSSQAEHAFLTPMDIEAMLGLQEYYRTIEGAVSYPEDLTEDQVFDLTWTRELLGQG